MNAVLPNGYLSILQAAEVLVSAIYAGVPDRPLVSDRRNKGLDVSDGEAKDRAIAELWKAVDGGTLRALAIGGRPRRILRLDPELTKTVPMLRNPRGRGLTSLRQSNPAYHQLASWFGSGAQAAAVAFRETEVKKLTRKLMRARRTAQHADGPKTRRGRPSRVPSVQGVIRDVVEQGRWSPIMGMKALTRQINRAEKSPRQVSQDTVIRALDRLYEQTKDRRFERVRHSRKPRAKVLKQGSLWPHPRSGS